MLSRKYLPSILSLNYTKLFLEKKIELVVQIFVYKIQKLQNNLLTWNNEILIKLWNLMFELYSKKKKYFYFLQFLLPINLNISVHFI